MGVDLWIVDINNDGMVDLFLGYLGFDYGRGVVQLYVGKLNVLFDIVLVVMVLGKNGGDWLGLVVVVLDDMDGDGF